MSWYTMTGNVIMHATIFGAFMPILMFIVMSSIRAIKRLLDRSYTNDIYKTKAKTILSYIKKHSGPVFQIQNQYC